MRPFLMLALVAAVSPLPAQAVIDPGMPKAVVLARLGPPAIERSSGDATYLFYPNSCERTCGMNDVVVLDKGVVTDAIFRSTRRRYSGTSSSPRAIPAAEARKARPSKPEGASGSGEAASISISGIKAVPAPAARPDKKPPR